LGASAKAYFNAINRQLIKKQSKTKVTVV